jgi:uncharacterized protein (DUF4415 family)
LDPKRPPTLSRKAKARLATIRDQDIDLTDIPETYDVRWTRPGALIPADTLRIDADVLEFFKTTGRRHQTRMNHE